MTPCVRGVGYVAGLPPVVSDSHPRSFTIRLVPVPEDEEANHGTCCAQQTSQLAHACETLTRVRLVQWGSRLMFSTPRRTLLKHAAYVTTTCQAELLLWYLFLTQSLGSCAQIGVVLNKGLTAAQGKTIEGIVESTVGVSAFLCQRLRHVAAAISL